VFQLFDDFQRIDRRPGKFSEPVFTFLNRSASVFWHRVRVELQGWYDGLGADDNDLYNRFRSHDDDQHAAALWELYMHQLFVRLGYSVERHPTLPGRRDTPDLLVVRGPASMIVEAVSFDSSVVAEGRHEKLEAEINDTINSIATPAARLFYLSVEYEAVGPRALPNRRVTGPIEAWLDALVPSVDSLHAAMEAPEPVELPKLRIERDGWVIDLAAFPVGPDARGRPDHRLWAMGSTAVGQSNDAKRLGKRLEEKAKKYGTPARPLVIAVRAITPTFEHTPEAVLFGSEEIRVPLSGGSAQRYRRPDGFCGIPQAARHRKASAVLMADGLGVHMLAQALPTIWQNPYATHPVPDGAVPLPGVKLVGGELERIDAEVAAHDLFGGRPDWPGPEPPFLT
jgi:hypothetical protein